MTFLYTKLAAQGIRRNARTYIPFILTAACMVMVFYITSFLSSSSFITNMSETLSMLLSLGTGIMVVFSAIFLFYTNSFLIRRRNKELGLYNILGMGKLSIARILLRESLMVYAMSMTAGLGLGILFSKLAELAAVKILGSGAVYGFSVSLDAIVGALVWYAVIFAAILLNTLRQIHFSNPVALLRSETEGERPPKTNVPAAVMGLILLGGAYFMALTIKDPMGALLVFFVAVLMVIVATYLLFVAGSVVMCRLLKRNKNYYYSTNHFVSVSQMAYRMKRNGAGLASICILSTMVLVTVSTTTCLFIGEEDLLANRYPRDLNYTVLYSGDGAEEAVTEFFENKLSEQGYAPVDVMAYRSLQISGISLGGGKFRLTPDRYSDEVCALYIIPAEYCELITGTAAAPTGNEAVIADVNGVAGGADSIVLEDFEPLTVSARISGFGGTGDAVATIYQSIYIFVTDEVFDRIYEYQCGLYGGNRSERCFTYNFDLDCSGEKQSEVFHSIGLRGDDGLINEKNGILSSITRACREEDRSDFYALYGGLFLLGVLLGGVFTLSAVLIMYYKQITEGFEDRRRFSILRKVGMTQREIKGAINSQVLTVFFLPLAAAGVHTAFAFPIISRIMSTVFGLNDIGVLAAVTVGCFAVFAALYVLIYKVTSRSYYSIVSSDGE